MEITCSNCFETVDIISRTISLPFLCDRCANIESGENTEMKTEPYFDHAAANEPEPTDTELQLIEQLETQTEKSEELTAAVLDLMNLNEQLVNAISRLNSTALKYAAYMEAELEESHKYEDLGHQAVARLMEEKAKIELQFQIEKVTSDSLKHLHTRAIELLAQETRRANHFVDLKNKLSEELQIVKQMSERKTDRIVALLEQAEHSLLCSNRLNIWYKRLYRWGRLIVFGESADIIDTYSYEPKIEKVEDPKPIKSPHWVW